jgi:oligopeptide transport system ATP-binding protein
VNLASVNAPFLEIDDVHVTFDTARGPVAAVAGVTLTIARGECLAVVGESGSGKTQLFLAALGLLPANGRAAGSIRMQGVEVLGADAATLREIRGARVGMVFQDPLSSLTPHLRVEEQLVEVLDAHGHRHSADAARTRALEALEAVGLPDARRRLRQYPHELSGGMRQRVALAAALIADPPLLIADEPTTALDVSVQAQVVELLRERRAEGLAIVFISHDLSLVATLADRIAVMYAGRIVECGPAREIWERPQHPYTGALLRAIPSLHTDRSQRLTEIGGQPARAQTHASGCAFEPRCPVRERRCLDESPRLLDTGAGRSVACHVVSAPQ